MATKMASNVDKKKSVGKKFRVMLKWGMEHMNEIKLYQVLDPIKNQLGLINMELAKLERSDPLYLQRSKEFDQVMLRLTEAKWFSTQAMSNGGKAEWKQAFAKVKSVDKLVQQFAALISAGSTAPLDVDTIRLQNRDSEILFAGDVPVLPSINPIVILQGSDFDMGYQYAKQLVEIFGSWILEPLSNRKFSDEDYAVIQKWEEQIREYAPEMIQFCEGWAAGAVDSGIQMGYRDVLELWTGHNPPMRGYIGEDGFPELGTPLCSGAAAWGRATKDGELVTISSGDHDPGFTITVIALPETGNNFMFCPFGATGDIPKGGQVYMFGHPGMNDKGLTYVHHGGGPKWVEPKESWGYGIRRAVSVMHILRFANSAQEALEMEMAMPIGDIGPGDPGHPGGFYADSSYGYVLEGRKDPVILREAGVMGETDFLYSANAPLHPDIQKAPWRATNQDQWEYDPRGGWYPHSALSKINFKTILASMEEPHVIGIQFATLNSRYRGRFMFQKLNQALGEIDVGYMKGMYRESHSVPDGSLSALRKSYDQGAWGDISPGNATNALVVITKPSERYFAHCVGPARRGMAPMSPKTFANPIYDETNTFWELKLEPTPEAISTFAREVAEQKITAGEQMLQGQHVQESVSNHFSDLLQEAKKEFESGMLLEENVSERRENDRVYQWAKATRAFTRAQVRAKQVINALQPVGSETV